MRSMLWAVSAVPVSAAVTLEAAPVRVFSIPLLLVTTISPSCREASSRTASCRNVSPSRRVMPPVRLSTIPKQAISTR